MQIFNFIYWMEKKIKNYFFLSEISWFQKAYLSDIKYRDGLNLFISLSDNWSTDFEIFMHDIYI